MSEKKREYVRFVLEKDITVSMPRESEDGVDLLAALMLLGGLLYSGLVRTSKDKEGFRRMIEDCFDAIKDGDFSELAESVTEIYVEERKVNEA